MVEYKLKKCKRCGKKFKREYKARRVYCPDCQIIINEIKKQKKRERERKKTEEFGGWRELKLHREKKKMKKIEQAQAEFENMPTHAQNLILRIINDEKISEQAKILQINMIRQHVQGFHDNPLFTHYFECPLCLQKLKLIPSRKRKHPDVENPKEELKWDIEGYLYD